MSFRLVPKSVTLNGIMALVLHYFTKFMFDVIVKQLPWFQNLLLIICDHINMICTIIQQLFVQNKLGLVGVCRK